MKLFKLLILPWNTTLKIQMSILIKVIKSLNNLGMCFDKLYRYEEAN